MRRAWIVLAAVLLAIGLGVGGVGIAPAGAKSSKPVQVDGKVNVKGTKDISSTKSASIELEADDYYFNPTFVKVQPGEKVRITFKNEGSAARSESTAALAPMSSLIASGRHINPRVRCAGR